MTLATLSASTAEAVAVTLDFLILRDCVVSSDAASSPYDFAPGVPQDQEMLESYLKSLRNISREQNTHDMLNPYHGKGLRTVIDAGCGPGVSTLAIQHYTNPEKIYLVDKFPTVLRLAEEALLTNLDGKDRNFEFNLGLVQNLEQMPDIPSVDMVFMRSVLRYIPLTEYSKVFKGVYAKLNESGVLLFDLPLKSEGEWMAAESTPFDVVAQIMHEQFGIPIPQALEDYHNQAGMAETVVSHLIATGFSEAEHSHLSQFMHVQDRIMKGRSTLSALYRNLHRVNENAHIELQHYHTLLSDAMSAKLSELDRQGLMHIGLEVFTAVR